MRILVATDHYPPFIGGAQIQSRKLARELASRGHDVAVATVWQNQTPRVEEDDGVRVYRLRQLRTLPALARPREQHHQPPFPDTVTVGELRRVIRDFRPDVVHSYGWFSYSCAAALVGTSIPLIVTARDYAYGCARRTLMFFGHSECDGPALFKCLGCAAEHYGRPRGWTAAVGVLSSRRLLRRKVSGIHSISTYVQAIVRRDFLDDRRRPATVSHEVIHDMISETAGEEPAAAGSAAASRLEELPPEPFILFVGAFRRIKGLEQLYAAYAMLDDPPPLVLIGTMEPDTPLPFPPGVTVLTDVPHAAVMDAWDKALFGVLPSQFPEPLGTVVFEAMSRGRPVIATKPGGQTDMVVDGETGFLVNRGDVAGLAAAMQRLSGDPELRVRLGDAARRRSELFAADVAVPRIERLYADALARRRRTGHGHRRRLTRRSSLFTRSRR
jgi:glycosyltransferase involved in cell wall biosynthesis